jgi:hypothetical protein
MLAAIFFEHTRNCSWWTALINVRVNLLPWNFYGVASIWTRNRIPWTRILMGLKVYLVELNHMGKLSQWFQFGLVVIPRFSLMPRIWLRLEPINHKGVESVGSSLCCPLSPILKLNEEGKTSPWVKHHLQIPQWLLHSPNTPIVW